MITQPASTPPPASPPPVTEGFFDLLAINPWRPPDAWWTRAVGINAGTQPRATRNRDGEHGCRWIFKALRFQRALAEARDDYYAYVRVLNDSNPLFWAHRLHEATELKALRVGVEARILARETNEEIASKVGSWPDVIEAFEQLFFNVRDRLDYPDFVWNSVLGQAAQRGLQANDYGLLWKIAGYTAGPKVLDAMIGHVPNPMWANREEDVPAFFQDTAIKLMKKKAAISALTVPVENHTQLPLLEAFVKYVEIERTTDSTGSADDQIQDGLQNLLNSLPYKTISVDNVKDVPAFEASAVELRTEELMLASAGYKIPGIEALQNLKFPEPAAKA